MVDPKNEHARLIEAYTATTYVVLRNGDAFSLRVGERSSALADSFFGLLGCA
jgi:hypothetical protein